VELQGPLFGMLTANTPLMRFGAEAYFTYLSFLRTSLQHRRRLYDRHFANFVD
jgi:hypothetical protein